MTSAPTPTICDQCFREDPECVSYDPPWDDFARCPACMVEYMPATENCDVCAQRVECEVFALFSVVSDRNGRPGALRHAVCDVERRLKQS